MDCVIINVIINMYNYVIEVGDIMKKLKILLIFVFSFLFINNVSALDSDLKTADVQDSAFESMISGFDES